MVDDLLNSTNQSKTILLPFLCMLNFFLYVCETVVELQVSFSDHRCYPLVFVANLHINCNNEGKASVEDT